MSDPKKPVTSTPPEAHTSARPEERVAPSQHLFQQLVVAITNGMISGGYNPSKIGPAMARDIVGAAKHLQDAIGEELAK